MLIDRSMDGVTPYRLEMQAKAVIENEKNLYDYWGDTYISITFCELSIENPEEIKKFNRLRYVFREDLSTKIEYVFERRL